MVRRSTPRPRRSSAPPTCVPCGTLRRALSAGSGSRLSQILQQTEDVTQHGVDYDTAGEIEPDALSVLGIGDYANALLGGHEGIGRARGRLNDNYLAELSFAGDPLKGVISVSGAKGDKAVRLRQLLEKLELELRDDGVADPPPSRGLGSNNLLFMASELLLLTTKRKVFHPAHRRAGSPPSSATTTETHSIPGAEGGTRRVG